jgi:hypothetical protein
MASGRRRRRRRRSMGRDIPFVEAAWTNCWHRNDGVIARINRGVSRAIRKRVTEKEIRDDWYVQER